MYFNHNALGVYKGASPHTHTHTHKRDPYINRMIIVLNIVGAMKFVQNTHTHTHTHTYIWDGFKLHLV